MSIDASASTNAAATHPAESEALNSESEARRGGLKAARLIAPGETVLLLHLCGGRPGPWVCEYNVTCDDPEAESSQLFRAAKSLVGGAAARRNRSSFQRGSVGALPSYHADE